MIQETYPMIVGGEEVLNERRLLAGVEDGVMMPSAASVRYLILFPRAVVRGHRDMPGAVPKACPCLDACAVFG